MFDALHTLAIIVAACVPFILSLHPYCLFEQIACCLDKVQANSTTTTPVRFDSAVIHPLHLAAQQCFGVANDVV